MFEVQGILHKIYQEQQVSNSFKKREFVLKLDDNPNYPEFVKFELIQDRCKQLDKFNEGDEVNVTFVLKGRAWTNPKGEEVYFNTLSVTNIELEGFNDKVQRTSKSVKSSSFEKTVSIPPPTNAELEDDLPF